MSKPLEFLTNGHVVTFTYNKKKLPSQSYSQTFMNIKLAQEGSQDTLYEADLDDNYLLDHFANLQLFYNYLNKHKKKDIVMYNNLDQITVMVEVDESEIQEEIIQLNKIQIMDEQQYEAILSRQNFYSDVFKTKIIQKIEKTVKNYYRAKPEKKEEKKSHKAEQSAIESSASIALQGKDQLYHLNQQQTFVQFDLPAQITHQNQFAFRIASLKSDKIYVYADYFNPAENKYIGTKRFVQFGKSFSSSFSVDQGHTLAVCRQEGQLVIKNVSSNDGKIFDESLGKKDGIVFRITVSLKQIL